MSIHASTTIDGDFQILDVMVVPPVPPGTPDGAIHEEGVTRIPLGEQTLSITFATEKMSAAYEFEVLEVKNTVDASPLVLSPEITEYSITGFSVAFNGAPDTANFYLIWDVVI